MNRKRLIATFALTTLLSGGLARAQAPAGYELALVNVDGTKTVVGQLPPSVYAPRVSPDGKRIAFETRDLTGPDGPRLWTAELSNLAGRQPLPLVGGRDQLGADVDAGRRKARVHRVRPEGRCSVSAPSGRHRHAEHLIDTRAAEGWMAGERTCDF